MWCLLEAVMAEEFALTTTDKNLAPSIQFNASNAEPIIKLCDNGDIYIKGRLAENDKEVVDAMREFLKLHGWIK